MRSCIPLTLARPSLTTEAYSLLSSSQRCLNSGISCSSVFSNFLGKLPLAFFLLTFVVGGLSLQVHAAAPYITQGANGPLSVTMSEDGSPTGWSPPALGATDSDTADSYLVWSVSSAASNGTATVSGAAVLNDTGGRVFIHRFSDTSWFDVAEGMERN